MTYDLLIIGGGINGCAIAREAALNGLSVLLVEKDDLASHTSSASTKLIHGGLRYLETYEFRLVRHALKERKRLMKAAPHLIHPKAFVLPHENAVRPWWIVRAGLLLYDLLGGVGNLPKSRALQPADTLMRAPLTHAGRGFVYWDCAVDDARLTIANAVDAACAGAQIATYKGLQKAARTADGWEATLQDERRVTARAIVNATGPWLSDVEQRLGIRRPHPIKLVKGSHIVLPALYAGEHAYMLQQPDRRIVFAIPWVHGTTMVGTTEESVPSPDAPSISASETSYLLEAANRAFLTPSREVDILYRWSGIRPLVDNGAKDDRTTTRDYVLDLNRDGPPILSVLGGKITTARHLAEEAVARIGTALGQPTSSATRIRPFPGGDLPSSFNDYLHHCTERWPFLGEDRADRMVRAYGDQLPRILHNIAKIQELGQDFGHGLTEVEVDWLMAEEWARTAEDVLWRRTKLGLRFDAAQTAALSTHMKGKHS